MESNNNSTIVQYPRVPAVTQYRLIIIIYNNNATTIILLLYYTV